MKTPQPRRPRRSSSDWALLVEQSKTSSLPLSEFCRQADVSLSQLYHWRRKLRAAAVPVGEGFTPIRLRAPGQEAAALPGGSIEVLLQNGRVVRVVGVVDTRLLSDVIVTAEVGAPC